MSVASLSPAAWSPGPSLSPAAGSPGPSPGSISPLPPPLRYYHDQVVHREYIEIDPDSDWDRGNRLTRPAEPAIERALSYYHYSRDGSSSASESSEEGPYILGKLRSFLLSVITWVDGSDHSSSSRDLEDDIFHPSRIRHPHRQSRLRSPMVAHRMPRSRSRSEHGQTRFAHRQALHPSLRTLSKICSFRPFGARGHGVEGDPDSSMEWQWQRKKRLISRVSSSIARCEKALTFDGLWKIDQGDGDPLDPPLFQPYHSLERWTHNDNHNWPDRPEDAPRVDQEDWLRLESGVDYIRSMMVIKEDPVDGSEVDDDREMAFEKLGLTVRWKEPVSYNNIQEITLPVPCPPDTAGDDIETTSVSKVYIWDQLTGYHNPFGCEGSECEGYSHEDEAWPAIKGPSEGPCKSTFDHAPQPIANVFDKLCRRDVFGDYETGLFDDAPLVKTSIKVATFNAKSDQSTGIGVRQEEELERIHHGECRTEFCAGSRTEEEARSELVVPADRGDKCRPDVTFVFEPLFGGVGHTNPNEIEHDEIRSHLLEPRDAEPEEHASETEDSGHPSETESEIEKNETEESETEESEIEESETEESETEDLVHPSELEGLEHPSESEGDSPSDEFA
ncbi:hypothetical protein IAR50_001016 [Cryptococcus sp. DSM 104548]